MSRISSRDFEPYDRKFFNREEDIAIEVKRYKQKEVSKKWIPLSNDVDWPLYCMNESNAIFIPRVYAALTYFTGKSDESYDPYKGSFSFRFLLNVNKAGKLSQYLYWIMHYRQFMRINLFQSVSKEDPRSTETFSELEETLFSERDAKEFTISFFYDLLDKMDQEKYEPKPFALKVDSNLRVLGFLNGQYFVTQHEEAEAYEKDYDRVLDLIKVDK